MTLDHYAATLELKSVSAPQRIIIGWAAGIGNQDRVQDVIEPAAFRKTLATKAPSAVGVFIGHKQDDLPMGIPLVIRADPQGLYTETLVKPGPAGDDLLATAEFLHRHGLSLGMSIGYRVPVGGAKLARGADGQMVRRLTEIDLIEYSFAASQSIANPAALVTGVKQAGGMMKYTIEARGGQFVLLDADGEEEGRYPTEAAAEAARQRLMRDGDEADTPGPKGKTAEGEIETKAWTTAYENNLPDSAFFFVEPGEKDGDGKTIPRTKRHFPYRDASGSVDLPHLRNAIARIPQATVPGLDKDSLQGRARRLLASAEHGSKTVDAPEWQQGAIPKIGLVAYSLFDVCDQLAAEHKAMTTLGDDTKGGQRIRGEMRQKLRDLAKALSDIAQWAEYVDEERDGAAKIARYQRELELLALAS